MLEKYNKYRRVLIVLLFTIMIFVAFICSRSREFMECTEHYNSCSFISLSNTNIASVVWDVVCGLFSILPIMISIIIFLLLVFDSYEVNEEKIQDSIDNNTFKFVIASIPFLPVLFLIAISISFWSYVLALLLLIIVVTFLPIYIISFGLIVNATIKLILLKRYDK